MPQQTPGVGELGAVGGSGPEGDLSEEAGGEPMRFFHKLGDGEESGSGKGARRRGSQTRR